VSGVTGSRFLPYGRQTIEEDDIDAVVEVLRSDYLTTGPRVGEFEAALAKAVGAPRAVAVSSGTAALHAACFAAGVVEGDEVIVPAVTFVATANCARYLNAEPVFADVDSDSGLVLPSEVERLAGPKTRAIIPVHLAGMAAPVSAIREIADSVNARVIEDASHALGAGVANADMTIFSFHPVKHITTGEGGAITCSDPELLEKLLLFRNHGIVRDEDRLRCPSPGPWYYEQQELGFNLRITDFQAALGISQLGKLGRFVARRRELAARYDLLLNELQGVTPVTTPDRAVDSPYHLYCVLIDFARRGVDRAALMRRLQERGVGTQVHYLPIPMQPYYQDRGWKLENFPGAQRYYERTLSLPLYPAMRDGDVDYVVDVLEQVLCDLG
jgi:UDP-4-amino-4,6-dideoxy-N-acetyl-beta-L-altrosamine transaminase